MTRPHPAIAAIAPHAPGWTITVDHVGHELRARRGHVAVFAPDRAGGGALLLKRIAAQERAEAATAKEDPCPTPS